MGSLHEVAHDAAAAGVRYAQCWEDADILLAGLAVRPGDACLSIASAGDNTLALLAAAPGRVVAIDRNPAQIACLELRVAAYRELEHPELLVLMGSAPGAGREDLYRRCRSYLSAFARAFWDARPDIVAQGIGRGGRFERYLALFRERLLPWVHNKHRVARLLQSGRATEERERFYREKWDTLRWRLLFRLFFSRPVMARLGRDPLCFRYARGSLASHLQERARYAATALDPADNPYLQWILTGRHGTALPFALRPENFLAIRAHLDRLEWRCTSLEAYLETVEGSTFDRFNLSDVFEYLSADDYGWILERLVRAGRPGARLAYWNLLAERRRPPQLADRLRPLEDLSAHLHRKDRAFFYSAFILEEIR